VRHFVAPRAGREDLEHQVRHPLKVGGRSRRLVAPAEKADVRLHGCGDTVGEQDVERRKEDLSEPVGQHEAVEAPEEPAEHALVAEGRCGAHVEVTSDDLVTAAVVG
jgi:hypothetical protein